MKTSSLSKLILLSLCSFFITACIEDGAQTTTPLRQNIGEQKGLKDSLRKENVTHIGAAVSAKKLYDVSENTQNYSAEYAAVVTKEFNSVTLENAHKWFFLVSDEGVYDFQIADHIVEWANERNINVIGHTVLWHEANPQFVDEASNNADLMRSYITEHTNTLLSHYNHCDSEADNSLCVNHWDVVNEVITPTEAAANVFTYLTLPLDKRFRENVYFQALGSSYIDLAFNQARAASPNASLWINDYSVEKLTKKSNLYYSVVREKVINNVPIDGVGFQSHVFSDHSPLDLLKNLKRFSQLGVKVKISELDVAAMNVASAVSLLLPKLLENDVEFFDLIALPTIGRSEEDQKLYYENYGAACAMVPACERLTVWGVSDEDSWLSAETKPLIFRQEGNNYFKKPTYFALAKGLMEYSPASNPASLQEPKGKVITEEINLIDVLVGSLIQFFVSFVP